MGISCPASALVWDCRPLRERFLFDERIMKVDIEKVFKKNAEWSDKYILTNEERDKLIREKFERARLYHEALRKREALLVGRR